MIDSTIVRAISKRPWDAKGETRTRLWGAPEEGQAKIHLLANELGLPVDFLVTGGQGNDCTQANDPLGDRLAVWGAAIAGS